MKAFVFAVAALAAAVALAAPTKYAQLATIAGRARCISRVAEGNLVIETWKRGNYVWANTNVQRRVISARQTNTFEDRLEAMRLKVDEWRAAAETNESDAKVTKDVRKAVKRAEKNISKIVKTIEQARKKATSEEETALYDLLIGLLEVTDDE